MTPDPLPCDHNDPRQFRLSDIAPLPTTAIGRTDSGVQYYLCYGPIEPARSGLGMITSISFLDFWYALRGDHRSAYLDAGLSPALIPLRDCVAYFLAQPRSARAYGALPDVVVFPPG